VPVVGKRYKRAKCHPRLCKHLFCKKGKGGGGFFEQFAWHAESSDIREVQEMRGGGGGVGEGENLSNFSSIREGGISVMGGLNLGPSPKNQQKEGSSKRAACPKSLSELGGGFRQKLRQLGPRGDP